jgi:hypothetical protein
MALKEGMKTVSNKCMLLTEGLNSIYTCYLVLRDGLNTISTVPLHRPEGGDKYYVYQVHGAERKHEYGISQAHGVVGGDGYYIDPVLVLKEEMCIVSTQYMVRKRGCVKNMVLKEGGGRRGCELYITGT